VTDVDGHPAPGGRKMGKQRFQSLDLPSA
jgi:hypothetical protein